MANRKKIKEYAVIPRSDEHGDYCVIKIESKGEEHFVQIDAEKLNEFKKYNWTVLYVRKEAKYIKRRVRLEENGNGNGNGIQLLHRFVTEIGSEEHIDHIDGNGFNCRGHNLRKATSQQNSQNRKSRKDTASKYKGVVWGKSEKKWIVRIDHNGKRYHIGRYESEIINGVDEGEKRAGKRYDEEAIIQFGSFARLNFPDERNIVTLADGKYKRSFLQNEREKKNLEKEIKIMATWKMWEIADYLEKKSVKQLTELCHYYGCGIEQLVNEIRQGTLTSIARKVSDR